jgi:hypothetical protein
MARGRSTSFRRLRSLESLQTSGWISTSSSKPRRSRFRVKPAHESGRFAPGLARGGLDEPSGKSGGVWPPQYRRLIGSGSVTRGRTSS